jgi:rubrerythrin
MKKMTEENVKAALAGESQAHIKYLAFAEKAASENLPNVARIFKANAYAEQIHATNYLRTLSAIGDTKENLAAAAGGENFEAEEMYPAYIAVAKAQVEKKAEIFLNAALQAEIVHRGIYQAASKAVESRKDAAAKPIHVCAACGFTMEGDAPDYCPVCGAPREKFVAF